MKETKLNQNNFIKNFTYNGNRISKVTDTVLNMNLGTNNYVYDSMGRIVSNTYSSKNTSSNYRTYKYDQYGQLIRENNEGLDKTFIYEYNNIGKAPNYSQYQHYYRSKGYDYSRHEIYNIMRKHQTYKSISDDVIDYASDFLFSFVSYPA